MKKIISLIVISVMLLSALAMNVGAADTFTKEDAEKLFQNTYELYHSIQNSIYYENGAKRAWIGCEWYDYNDFSGEKEFTYNGEKFETRNIIESYNNADGLKIEIKSIQDVKKLVGTFCTSDYEKYFLNAYSHKYNRPLFFEDSASGKTYYCDCGIGTGWPFHYIEKYGDFTVNGDKATLEVYAYRLSSGSVAYVLEHYKSDVEFTKTADGWRISEGKMLELMFDDVKETLQPYIYKSETFYYSTPNTSDPTAIIIALLALSGIAIAVVSRKRRKMF